MNKNKKILFFVTILFQVLFLLLMLYSKYSIIANGQKILIKVNPVDPESPLRGQYVTLRYDFSRIEMEYDESLKKGSLVYAVLEKDGRFHHLKEVKKQRPVDLNQNELYLVGKLKYPSRKDSVFLDEFIPLEKDKEWFYKNRENIDIPDKIISFNGKYEEGKTYYFTIDKISNREKEWRINTYSGKEDVETLRKNYHYKDDLKIAKVKINKIESILKAQAKFGIEAFFVEEGKGSEIEKYREKGDIYVEVAVSEDGEAILTRLFAGDKEYK